jgi:hypothetical protein
MRITIDVNGVLRDTIGKFTRVYESYLIENNLEIGENNLVVTAETDNFVYEITGPVTSLTLTDFFKFKNEEEYLKFIYEEFPMQIFGHAGSSENNTFNLLNDFYIEQRDQNDIIIISEEVGKAKPATLFFLSKFGCLIEKIRFYSKSTKDSIWDDIDILLTANPDLLLNYPTGKTLIKFETDYNKQVDCPLTIKSLEDFLPLITNITK